MILLQWVEKMCFALQIHARSVDHFLLLYENVYVGLSEYFVNSSRRQILLLGSAWQPCSKTQSWSQPFTKLREFLPQEISLLLFSPLVWKNLRLLYSNSKKQLNITTICQQQWMSDRDAANAYEMWVRLRLSHWFFLTKIFGATS